MIMPIQVAGWFNVACEEAQRFFNNILTEDHLGRINPLQESAGDGPCLLKIEDHTAISSAMIISHADLVQAIAAIANIVAGEPLPRPLERLAIA